MFTKTYKNKDGGTGGKLVLFHQDKKVVDSQAFSGNSNHKSTLPIANGDYYMRLDIRTTSNPVKLLNTEEGPQPEIQWGLENFPKMALWYIMVIQNYPIPLLPKHMAIHEFGLYQQKIWAIIQKIGVYICMVN